MQYICIRKSDNSAVDACCNEIPGPGNYAYRIYLSSINKPFRKNRLAFSLVFFFNIFSKKYVTVGSVIRIGTCGLRQFSRVFSWLQIQQISSSTSRIAGARRAHTLRTEYDYVVILFGDVDQ